MTLKEFSKKKNIIETLLSALNLIEEKTKITKIDFYPDFDIFEYDRHNDKEYYFTGIQTFDNNHNYVLDCEFISPFVFPYDRLDEIEEHEDIVFSDKENLIESVKELDDFDYNLIEEYSFPTDFDGFKLNNIKVKYINNTKKEIIYEGGFLGASMNIDPDFWDLFSYINVKAIKKNQIEFFKDLLGESYILKLEGNYKLSFFILFSALENYINFKLNKTEHEGKRLKELIGEVYKTEHEIETLISDNLYTSLMNDINKQIEKRNVIAHGKNDINISANELNSFLLCVLTYIISVEFKWNSFQEIFEKT
ncbi:hypothetical protein OZ663_11900 [Elizabethkingia sp. HX CGY]|uniref:hypothetical protein n=1 Tax=Elizabethkingia sp. HX CGY TaxID=3003196 RepID=UPI002A23C7E1|nr:hypothetical protein [Elizabethkingia sp. HX CGY]MDX8557373.1 hypothetical protein [Elizabethkingia sp. HX CGY]